MGFIMDDQNKNLLMATALSVGVMLLWFALSPPTPPQDPAATDADPTTTTAAQPVAETAVFVLVALEFSYNLSSAAGIKMKVEPRDL